MGSRDGPTIACTATIADGPSYGQFALHHHVDRVIAGSRVWLRSHAPAPCRISWSLADAAAPHVRLATVGVGNRVRGVLTVTKILRRIGYWDGRAAPEGLPDVCGFVCADAD